MKIKTMLLSLLVILMVVLLAAGIIKLEKQVSQIENDGLAQKIGLLEKEIDYLKNQLSIKEEQTTTESIKNTESKQIADINWDDTDSWKTYENKDLGFSFKYPAEFGNFVLSINNSVAGTSFYQGKEFIGNFDNAIYFKDSNKYFAIGGITEDFAKQTEGYFLTFIGYQKINDKYYLVPYKEKSENNESIIVTKILNLQGKEVLFVEYDWFGGALKGKGAYINLLGNSDFKGMAIENMTLTQEQFEKILSTFSFAK